MLKAGRRAGDARLSVGRLAEDIFAATVAKGTRTG